MKFNSKYFLCILLQSVALLGRTSIEASNLLSSLGTITQGVSKELINIIPTPEELFNLKIETLVGLPEQAVFKAISDLCTLYMASDTINPRIRPNVSTMALRWYTKSNVFSFPLKNASNILLNPEFESNKKLAVFVGGWGSTSDSDNVVDMANAFNSRGNYNFLVLNSSDSIDTLYTWSAYNTEEVGRQLALSLMQLLDKVPLKNIHVIGHSLGAHIAGYTGQYILQYTGLFLPRITGLDPANPCFNEGQTLSGLQRGDADFIDIIHTNPGVLGKKDPVGDIDFFVNGLEAIKPGCIKFSCSHLRAYKYFTETVYPGNENNFLGVRCTSLFALNNGFCKGAKYPMGLAVPYNMKGNFFLSANANMPYGQNHEN